MPKQKRKHNSDGDDQITKLPIPKQHDHFESIQYDSCSEDEDEEIMALTKLSLRPDKERPPSPTPFLEKHEEDESPALLLDKHEKIDQLTAIMSGEVESITKRNTPQTDSKLTSDKMEDGTLTAPQIAQRLAPQAKECIFRGETLSSSQSSTPSYMVYNPKH